jgi:uncharacterized membrane protein YdjX (TVP38/TMEM64 family)
VFLGFCAAYIFMQTFMIPGTIVMSLLAGSLFGPIRGMMVVIFNASAGASSCFFLSKLVGRPLALWMWPGRLQFFKAEVGPLKIPPSPPLILIIVTNGLKFDPIHALLSIIAAL